MSEGPRRWRYSSVGAIIARRDFDVKQIAEWGMFSGATRADVERIVRRALKDMVIKGGEHLETARGRENAGSGKRRNLERCTNRSVIPQVGSGKIGTLA